MPIEKRMERLFLGIATTSITLVAGAMMWLISDSEAAAFVAIVVVMVALALVVAL